MLALKDSDPLALEDGDELGLTLELSLADSLRLGEELALLEALCDSLGNPPDSLDDSLWLSDALGLELGEALGLILELGDVDSLPLGLELGEGLGE